MDDVGASNLPSIIGKVILAIERGDARAVEELLPSIEVGTSCCCLLFLPIPAASNNVFSMLSLRVGRVNILLIS